MAQELPQLMAEPVRETVVLITKFLHLQHLMDPAAVALAKDQAAARFKTAEQASKEL